MTLAGYREVRVLHDGVRTRILRARRLSDDRSVVLKQLRTPFPSAAEIARLRREHDLARAAAGPGVIAVYGLHVGEGTAWLEMEDCAGGSLADRAARHALTPLEVVELVDAAPAP